MKKRNSKSKAPVVRSKKASQRIELESDARRMAALVLIMMGKSISYIVSKTKLTQGQVTYLYRNYCDLSIRDVRAGTGERDFQRLNNDIWNASKEQVQHLLTLFLEDRGKMKPQVISKLSLHKSTAA